MHKKGLIVWSLQPPLIIKTTRQGISQISGKPFFFNGSFRKLINVSKTTENDSLWLIWILKCQKFRNTPAYYSAQFIL